jgi:hypothetical protein
MSIFASWIVTLGFFFVLFLVGKLLQYKERREKITKRATDAIRAQHRVRVGVTGTFYEDSIFGPADLYTTEQGGRWRSRA